MSKEKYTDRLGKVILETALYLQRYKDFLISKKDFYKCVDWWKEVKKEFYNPELKLKLVKSDGNFDRLLRLEITNDIMKTNFKSLRKFKLKESIRLK